MGPCGQPGAAYIADDLTLPDPHSRTYSGGDPRHVQILSRVGAVVLDLYIVPVASTIGSLENNTITHRANRGSRRSRKIRPEVSLPAFLHRVKSPGIVPGT